MSVKTGGGERRSWHVSKACVRIVLAGLPHLYINYTKTYRERTIIQTRQVEQRMRGLPARTYDVISFTRNGTHVGESIRRHNDILNYDQVENIYTRCIHVVLLHTIILAATPIQRQ